MWVLLAAQLFAAAVDSADDRLLTVSVDLSTLDRQRYTEMSASGLYKSLLVRLVGEQLAFIEAAESAAIRVRFLAWDGAAVSIAVTTEKGRRERLVAFKQPSDKAAQLRVIHAVIELVRQARSDLAAPAIGASPPRADVVASKNDEVEPSNEVERHSTLGTTAGVAMLWSAGKAGALFDLGATLRLAAVTLALGAALHEPTGLPSELRLRDWAAYAGVTVTRPFAGHRVEALGGLDLGLCQQRYRYQDAAGASDQGTRLDPLLVARLGVMLAPSAAWRVGLQAGAFMTMRDRVHRTAGAILWHAPPTRPFAGFLFTFSP